MQIDFISDTICPWCFIGKRRLARAMALRPNIIFNVRHRPYRLDPAVPRGGVDRKAYLAARFPTGIEEAHRAISAEGAKEDIAFAWNAILKTPNTIDSHRLIRWAETQGVQDEVVEKLFIAYFENGEVWVSPYWSARSGYYISRGLPLDMLLLDEGVIGLFDCAAVPVGAKNKKLAYELLNFML